MLSVKKVTVSQVTLYVWNWTDQTIAVINDARVNPANETMQIIFVKRGLLADNAAKKRTNPINSIIAKGVGPVSVLLSLLATWIMMNDATDAKIPMTDKTIGINVLFLNCIIYFSLSFKTETVKTCSSPYFSFIISKYLLSCEFGTTQIMDPPNPPPLILLAPS